MSDFFADVNAAYEKISAVDSGETWWHKYSELTEFREVLRRRGCLICLLKASDQISDLALGIHSTARVPIASKSKLKQILEQSNGYLDANNLFENLAVCKDHAVDTEVLLGQGPEWSLIVAVRMYAFLWPLLHRVTCLTDGAAANGKWIVFGCRRASEQGSKPLQSVLSFAGFRMIVPEAVPHIRREMNGQILRRLKLVKSDYVSFVINFLLAYPNHMTGSRVDTAVNLVRPILYGLGVKTLSGSLDDDHSRVWDWIERSFPVQISMASKHSDSKRQLKLITAEGTQASASRQQDRKKVPSPPAVEPPKRTGPPLRDPNKEVPAKPKYTQIVVLQASGYNLGFGHLCIAVHPSSEEWKLLSKNVDASLRDGSGGWLTLDFAGIPKDSILDSVLSAGLFDGQLRIEKSEDFTGPLIREGSVKATAYNAKYLAVENACFDAFIKKVNEYRESTMPYNLYVNNCTHAASDLVNALAPSVVSLRHMPLLPKYWFDQLPGDSHKLEERDGVIIGGNERYSPAILKAIGPTPNPKPAPAPVAPNTPIKSGGLSTPNQPPTAISDDPFPLSSTTKPKSPSEDSPPATEPPLIAQVPPDQQIPDPGKGGKIQDAPPKDTTKNSTWVGDPPGTLQGPSLA